MLDPEQIAEIHLRWRIVLVLGVAMILLLAAVKAALPYLEM